MELKLRRVQVCALHSDVFGGCVTARIGVICSASLAVRLSVKSCQVVVTSVTRKVSGGDLILSVAVAFLCHW